MAIKEIITANCENGQLSKSKIARQWDDQGTLIQFAGYPEPDTDEQLIFKLIVWMRASEDAEPDELPPIELEADQWLISNYYTQLPQMLRFQLCITNEAGTYEKHSPIFSGTVDKSLSHDGEEADIDVNPLFDPYKKYVDELILDAGARVVDTELNETSTNLVENKAVATAVTDINGRLPLKVRLSTNGTAPPGTFGKIVTAFSKGAVVYGYTSTSGKVLYTLTSVDLVSTPLDYDVGTLTFTHVRADVGWLSQIQLKYLGEDETWSYSSYDVADKMTSQEATNLLSIAKGGS